jgi:catechol 2,3-dioxygenase
MPDAKLTLSALPPETHIGRVALQISDLERSIAFYRDGLGFTMVEEYVEGGTRVACLGTDASSACLLELHERHGARPVPSGGRLGLYHFAVLLPSQADLGRFVVHAANTGLQFAAADHLFSEALYLTDPDGLQVEVYRDRPRESWEYRDGEVVAETLRLNLDRVVAAAADTRWSGLPTGTSIGHVHLYVGDLNRARRFYVDGLGFAPSVTTFPGALFVAAGGYHHHVGLNTWATGAPVAGADDARLLWWELLVPDVTDVDAATARLASAGLEVTTDATGARTAADAWGIAVRLVAKRRHAALRRT